MNTITYEHPVTGEVVTVTVSNLMMVDGARSHNPVTVTVDGTIDAEDWFYRVLDKYNGPIVGRYNRSLDTIWQEVKKTIVGIVILSFSDWKRLSGRICGNAQKPEYTFKSLMRQINEELFAFDDSVNKSLAWLHNLDKKTRFSVSVQSISYEE